MIRRAPGMMLWLLPVAACDALVVEPAPAPADLHMRFGIADFDSEGFGRTMAKVDRVRLTLSHDGLTRDTIVPAEFEDGILKAFVSVDEGDVADALGIHAKLMEGFVTLFEGGRTITGGADLTTTVALYVVPVPDLIYLEREQIAFDALGDTVLLDGEVGFANGDTIPGATISWSTDDPDIAEVVSGSRLIPRALGATNLNASHGSIEASRLVSVAQVASTLRGVAPADTTIVVGDTMRLRPFGVDESGFPLLPGAVVDWSPVGPVAVDSFGLVTALAPGDASIEGVVGPAHHTALVTVIAAAAGSGGR